MGRRHTPESFWARVDVRGPDDCWPWLGAFTRSPYGDPSYGSLSYQGRHCVAHRKAYELHHGVELPPWPVVEVLHSCDDPGCCNPAHLREGSQSDNMVDRRDRGRHLRYPQRDAMTGRWVRGVSVDKGQ